VVKCLAVNDYCMCRLQGVKMHIATSLSGRGPWTTWLVDGSELGLPVTSQIWIVSFPFKLNSVYHVCM